MRRSVVTEIAFDSNVSSAHTMWTNVSGDVSAINARLGRNAELDQIETGECTITLDNADGLYTPGRSVTGGYGTKIKPRRPVRVYTILDDNLVHFECVNPVRTGEFDVPRFYTGSNVSITPSGNVWMVAPTVTTATNVWVGANSDADEISVKAGDQIRLSANCYNQVSGDQAGIGVAFFPRTDTGQPYSFSSYAVTTGTSTGTVVTHSYTAPADGTIRMMLWSTVATVGNKSYFRNLKMSFFSTDADYSVSIPAGIETASGMYPVFRGYVDTWTVNADGFTSEAQVRCVDWLGVASRPIGTYYREKFMQWLKNRVFGVDESIWYWSCFEEAADTSASLSFTNTTDLYTLGVIKYASPTTGGFTTGTPTLAYLDGASTAGGFTEDDDNLAKGAVLSLVDRGLPTLSRAKSGNAWGTTFWFKGEVPTAGRSCLWHVTSPSGQTFGAVYMETSGKLTCEVDTGSGVVAASSSVSYVTGTPVQVVIAARWQQSTGTFTVETWTQDAAINPAITCGVSGVFVSSNNGNLPVVGYMQWGGRIFGTTNQDFCRGTFNHVTFILNGDFSGTLNTDVYNGGMAIANPTNTYSGSSVVNDILTFAGFPLNKVLDTGASYVFTPCWENQADANQALMDAAGDESGVFFMGPDGSAIFHNRTRRMSNVSRWSLSEWSSDLTFVLDSSAVVNQVTAQRNTDLSQTLSDDASIAEIGVQERTVRRNLQDASELIQAAGWILHRYRGTNPRCDRLELDVSAVNGGSSDAAFLGFAHGGTISDRLTVSGLPPTAPSDSLMFYIEGVETSIQVDGSKVNFTVTFAVSDANRSIAFILEDSTYGILDGDASVLAY